MNDPFRRMKMDKIKKILDQILSDEADLLALMDSWPFPKGPFLEEEENLRHVLDHYVADEDIRSREPDYDKTQKESVTNAYERFLSSNVKSN